MDKFFNEGIIGNQKMIVTYTKNGEMIRLFYPNIDFKQNIDLFHVGVKINDSQIICLHKDINNIYEQKYIEDTNVLKTRNYKQIFQFKN